MNVRRNPAADGARIAEVTAGSPAAGAGLVPGESVLRVDDVRITGFTDLVARIGAHAPGETARLTVRGTERRVARRGDTRRHRGPGNRPAPPTGLRWTEAPNTHGP